MPIVCCEALGSITKSAPTKNSKSSPEISAASRENIRSSRYKQQKIAANILPDFRVNSCLKILTKDLGAVSVQRHMHGDCLFAGLINCGSAWVCPVCHVRIMERRKIEIAEIFIHWAKQERKWAHMLTFTFPHSIHDALNTHADALVAAYRDFTSHNVWGLFAAKIGYCGCIKSFEILWGQKNGWHGHFHVLWFHARGVDLKLQQVWLVDRWIKCLERTGLSFTEQQKSDMHEHSIDITRAHDGNYLSKLGGKSGWGIENELTKATNKKHSQKELISPFQLLDLAENDKTSADLFREYALATKGKARIFISKNLRDAVGITEKSDEELCADIEILKGCVPVGYIKKEYWYAEIIKKERRAEILHIAETEGATGLARVIGADFQAAVTLDDEIVEVVAAINLTKAQKKRDKDKATSERKKEAAAAFKAKLEAKQIKLLAAEEKRIAVAARKGKSPVKTGLCKSSKGIKQLQASMGNNSILSDVDWSVNYGLWN